MAIHFKVFPSKGYKNTSFCIRFFKPANKLIVHLNGNIIHNINLSDEKFIILTNLKKPGHYIFSCFSDSSVYTEDVDVVDGLRFGTSIIKKIYTFTEIDYVFAVMNDRLIIHDAALQTSFEIEGLSPTEINVLDDNNILCTTRLTSETNSDQKIANYAIFSLRNFSIVWESTNRFTEIFFDKEQCILWTDNSNEKQLYCFTRESLLNTSEKYSQILSYESLAVIKSKKSQLFRWFFAQKENTIVIGDLITCQLNTLDKKSVVAIDFEKSFYLETFQDTLQAYDLYQNRRTLSVKIPKTLNLDPKDWYYCNPLYCCETGNSQYDDISEMLIQNYLPNTAFSGYSAYIDLMKSDESISKTEVTQYIFPHNGILHFLESTVTCELRSITYKRNRDREYRATKGERITYTHDLFCINNGLKTFLEKQKKQVVILDLSCKFDFLLIKCDNVYLLYSGGKIRLEIPIGNISCSIRSFGEREYLFTVNSGLLSVEELTNGTIKRPIVYRGFQHGKNLMDFNERLYYSTAKDSNYFEKIQKLLNEGNTVAHVHPIANRVPKMPEIHCYDLRNSKYCGFFIPKSPSEIDTMFSNCNYFLNETNSLVDVLSMKTMDSVVGKIESVSKSLLKVITHRNDSFILNSYNSMTGKYEILEFSIPIMGITEAHIDASGKYLVLSSGVNEYTLFDVEVQEPIRVFTEKFISFSKEGNIILENNLTRSALIVDPLTFESVTALNYHHYKFISPDGELYCATSIQRRYYNRLSKTFITILDFQKHVCELGLYKELSPEEMRRKNNIIKCRNKFYIDNQDQLVEIGISDEDDISSRSIIDVYKVIEIGKTGTQETVEIRIPDDIVYFNFAAFSYDNSYFGYVGKPGVRGLIHLVKINFNGESKSISFGGEYISRIPNWASWVCAFSAKGYFATYDSSPDTYLIKVDDSIFNNQDSEQKILAGFELDEMATSIKKSYMGWSLIKKKNFMCFSHKGDFMALSEQGYEPLTLGGYGHMESKALHVADVETGQIVDSFIGHGASIKMAAFTVGEKKLLSVSTDGVVFLRTIEIEKNQ